MDELLVAPSPIRSKSSRIGTPKKNGRRKSLIPALDDVSSDDDTDLSSVKSSRRGSVMGSRRGSVMGM